MTVLVAYATAHGSTKDVAKRIGERLRVEGVGVDVQAADEVEDVSGYAAVVLGSAVHNGRWLTPASALLAQIREQSARPLWLFSVCTVGDTTSFLGPRLSRLARRRRKLPSDIAESSASHRFFAGVIEKSHWNMLGRLFFVVTGGRYGDHRDWEDIDRWADTIRAELTAEAAGT
jgi:menaquinone-dependent protoporphyrinogen oxidase